MFRILLDLLTMCGKIKKYAPKWWFFMVFCHGPKQKNTLNKSKILELPKIRFFHLFNTNLQSAKSVLYLAPKQLHGPPSDVHPRESQGKSTKSSLASFIFDINFNIQVHWWWVCCRFTCFICGKILEQGVKVTKIRQHLDYAQTSVRKPIIPILTASNLLQTYEWFVQNLVHCLADPWPLFFFDPPNAWDALNFREKK